ncbi:MAG: glycosyltransferase family 87 protein [Mucinivorans sp.]
MKSKLLIALDNKWLLLGLYLAAALWTLVVHYAGDAAGGLGYNNYDIYTGVARHFFDELPLYGHSPSEYHDMNHYGPLFAFLIYPFTLFPRLAGLALWVAFTAIIYWWAIRCLPLARSVVGIILVMCLPEFYNAALYQQFNTVTAALIVCTWITITSGHEATAAVLIVVGSMVKIYGIVGLAFFFFIPPSRRWYFVRSLLLWTVALLVLQLIFTSWDYLWSQYVAWGNDLVGKHGTNIFSPFQNRGLLGMIRKLTGSASYSDMWVLVPAMVIYCSAYLRYRHFDERRFRFLFLASTLLFIVLFSSGTETPSYIMAMTGVSLWWFAARSSHTVLDWCLLCFVFIGTFANAIFPHALYLEVIFAYALKALPFSLVWLKIMYELTLSYRKIDGKQENFDCCTSL